MRQVVAGILLISLFVVLVGSRFEPKDGDKLANISNLALARVRAALPPEATLLAPVNALRKELPQRLEDRVMTRLESDKRLEGIQFTVSSEGAVVKLHGVLPDSASRRRAVSIATQTIGVEKVIDELAVQE